MLTGSITRAATVGDFMTKRVMTSYPHLNVMNAIKTMSENNIGSLVVVDSNGPVGIFTERNLLSDVLAKGIDPVTVLVTEVLTQLVVTINPEATLPQAAKLMINRKSRLMVHADGDLEGILTATDIVRFVQTIGPPLDLTGVISRGVVTETPETPLSTVIRDMNEKRIGSVLVTENGRPDGIFTERDLLVKVLARRRSLDDEVGQFASSPITTAPLAVDGVDAARMMVAHRIKRLPLTLGKDVAGIVTARDVVEAFARSS